MKCEFCHNNEANLHFKQMSNGEMKELFVCESCAAEQGLSMHPPLSLSHFLFDNGTGKKGPARTREVETTCPSCGMRLSEFNHASRLGCAQCYTTLRQALLPLLRSMHNGMSHRGKLPSGAPLDTKLQELQSRLREAVAGQRFEEAALWRDRIRALNRRTQATHPLQRDPL